MKATDLTGEARRLYEVWRDAGLSESAALEEVENSGVVFEQELREAYEARGMSPEAARLAAQGRGGTVRAGHPFDRLVEAYKSHGLSAEAARLAAIGRNGAGSQQHKLSESATMTRGGVALVESARLVEAAGGRPTATRFRARLIAGDVQGSSGYYPAATLRESAGAFHVDLPVYLDHPSVSDSYERPERSVRDLAGRLVETATYQGDGLYSTIEVFPHMAPLVESLADFIGLSIRASGEVEPSTSGSIRGPIVTAITEAASVDLVTAAGAGGRLMRGAA